MDARRLKSRAKLRTALAELLQQYSLEEISIEQITEKAGVTRPTFYSNYDSRQDIINEHVGQWLEQREVLFDEYIRGDQTPGYDRLRSLIEHMLLTINPDDMLLKLALSGRAGDQALDMVRQQHIRFFRKRAEQGLSKPVDDEELRLITTFYSGAILSVIVEVLRKELPFEPVALSHRLASMIYRGISHLITQPDRN